MKSLIPGGILLTVLLCAAFYVLSSKHPPDRTPAQLPPISEREVPSPAAQDKPAAPLNSGQGGSAIQPASASPAQALPVGSSPDAANPFSEFSDWAAHYLANSASVSDSRGVALAWKRREALLELITNDPEKALRWAVPFHWRTSLPPKVTQYFEEQIDGRGSFQVALGEYGKPGTSAIVRQVRMGDRAFAAFVYGRRLTQQSQKDLPLHGIVLNGKLALSSHPMRIIDPVEAVELEKRYRQHRPAVCSLCSKPADTHAAVIAETGGELASFCGVDHQMAASADWIKQEKKELPYAKDLNAWTLGPKTVLYMRVNFPDDLTEPISESAAYDVMDRVNDFYVDSSYDLTSLTATVTPLLTLPRTKASYSDAGPFALLEDARAAARIAGFDHSFFDLDIVCHTSVPGFDWGGLGMVGGSGTWLQSSGVGVTAHELGHNYGVMHANFWDTTTNNFSGIGAGWSVEYGNNYDTMGAAAAGRNQFNAFFKNQLQWLPSTAVANVTTSGVYRIYSFDLPQRVIGPTYAARVPRDTQRDYWLEMRQQFSSDRGLGSGLLLNWSPWMNSNGGTDLIDTTPLSVSPDPRADAALVVGRTFSDLPAGVHVTPLARGVDGSNSWLDVQINLGTFIENQPPFLQLQLDIAHPQPGELVHLHAEAIDPDGDQLAYAWSIDNVEFSTNNLPWIGRSWPGPGSHVVRCEVSDMKGGVATANAVVVVGTPSGFLISGRLVDTNGVPVQGARVDNLADANACQSLVAYTDSDGWYALPGVRCEANLLATKYGFTFTNIAWTNPIPVGNDSFRADYVATAMPVVTISSTTNEVPESSAALASFLIQRGGDVSTNLIVQVLVTGSATFGTDYVLPAPFATGVNAIEFAPGQTTFEVRMRPVTDSVVEGTETVTLELLDQDTYVIGALGQSTISIRENDPAGPPLVTVASSNALIPENGTDAGEVVFTRTGSTMGDLLVSYDVTGTATPGVDYQRPLGLVLIPSGQSSARVRFIPIDDKIVEPDESIVITPLPGTAYYVNGSTAQLTIIDDDTLSVTISATDAPAAEPSTSGRFTVKREGDLTPNLLVFYTVSGTATPGEDYAQLSGSVLIPAGAASAEILVTPRDDLLVEGDESVTVTLSTNAAYDIGTPASATLLIMDDEKPTVSVSVGEPVASEPGDQFASFIISRGTITNGALTVYLAISGTALNGIDYVPLDNAVVIPDGARQVTLEVIPFDDLHAEPTETVELLVLPSTNYNVGSPLATVFIEDDDYGLPAVGFMFAASQAPEGQPVPISIALSSTSSSPVTVSYRVIGGTASANDYLFPTGLVTIGVGKLTAVLPLQIRDNATRQPDRTIRIALYDPISATLDGIKIHTYTILDDDAGLLTIEATVPDAFERGPIAGNFRISRAGPTDSPQTVYFEVAGSASAPGDYAPLGNSILIPVGASYVDLPVIPVADAIAEHDETVTVELIRAPGARVVSPNTAAVIIHDDLPPNVPLITITSTNGLDAVEGGSPGEFTIFRDRTDGELTVSLTTSGTAVAGQDYNPLPNSVTFAPGVDHISLFVTALADSTIEAEETVVLALTRKDTYACSYPGSATVVIQDRDQKVRIDASDFYAAEPGTDRGEFTFTRFGSTNGNLLVHFDISGTAANGVDYLAISNAFVIPAGASSAKLPIVPLDDLLVEGPETVTITLLPAPEYQLDAPMEATLTIDDDEPMLTVVASAPRALEGGRYPGVFTITRTGSPRYELTAYVAFAGTADYGIDYPPIPTSIFFRCGVTEVDVPVYPVNEMMVEGDETITMSLLPDPAYTVLSPSNAVVTIEDVGLNRAPEITIRRPASPLANVRGPNVMLLLQASVTDDGPTNAVTNTWSMIAGPSPVLFGTPDAPNTTAAFTNAGFYVLRLTADDGQLQSSADIHVNVTGPSLFSDALLHWTFDEGTGSIAADLSGNGRNGVLVGTPLWTNGALAFDDPTEFVRGLGTSNLFDGREKFSVSLWFNTLLTNADQAILCANSQATNGTLALYTRQFASCGQGTNVYEITLRTTAGLVRYVSSSGAVREGWHNLLFAWSSGSGIQLFIDGVPDRPGTRSARLAGRISNAPEFLIGKGPIEAPFSLQAQVDEVLVLPRAVTADEAIGIGGGGCCGGEGGGGGGGGEGGLVNFGPEVDAGTNLTVQLPVAVQLAGTVTDDGLPDPPAAVSNVWVLVSGPAPVSIPDPNALTNTIRFPEIGTNIFRLIADDGEIATCDEVTIIVIEPTRVDIWAADYEAAELGPDTAEFTLMRSGELNSDLTVYLDFSGIATNGIDFVRIPDSVTFSNGADTVSILITPYLDHRTEGDQDLTITIKTNLAYTVGNSPASIVIHDSPYGMWTIEHFTLEELTDPLLSGESADFDHDGLVNFVEYASNQDPKVAATNAPLVTKIETDPADNLPHVMLSFHRRLAPADVIYAPSVSNDLITWQSGTNYVEEVQVVDDGNAISETVKARVLMPLTVSTNLFVTVRVWLNATEP